MHNGGTMDTEYKCTICYDIFLYPVRLPCMHRFCKLCLDKHIENNKMCCPICRFRISNWLRQLRRSNGDIVDKPFWDTVQKLYPMEIEKRMNGHVGYHSPPTVNDVPTRRLSKPGEIHQEYEEFLQKELEEKRRQDEENFRLSEAMVTMIEEDERREEEERIQQLQTDEELARRLEQEASAESNKTPNELSEDNMSVISISSDCSSPLLPSRPTVCFDTPSTSKAEHQHLQSPVCHNIFIPPTSKETSVQSSQSPARSDILPTSKETSVQYSQSPARSDIPPPSKKNVFSKFFTGTSSSSSSHTRGQSLLRDTSSADSKTSSISNKELSDFATVPSNVTNGPKTKKKETLPSSSRCSSGGDSIGQELNHFKPIRSSPTTPPKEGSRGLIPKMVVAQRGVGVPDLSILPPVDLLSANISQDELETSLKLEKQLEEDKRLAMEIQKQLNNEVMLPVKGEYNLRKRKRSSGSSLKKKVLLDRAQTTLDNHVIK